MKLNSFHPYSKKYFATNGNNRNEARRMKFDPDINCGGCFLIGGLSCDLKFRCMGCEKHYYCSLLCRDKSKATHEHDCPKNYGNTGCGFVLPHKPLKFLRWNNANDESTAKALGLNPNIHCMYPNCLKIGGHAGVNLDYTCPICNSVRYCSARCFEVDTPQHTHYCTVFKLAKEALVNTRTERLRRELAEAKEKLEEVKAGTVVRDVREKQGGDDEEQERKPAAATVAPSPRPPKKTEQVGVASRPVPVASMSASTLPKAKGIPKDDQPKKKAKHSVGVQQEIGEEAWKMATNRPNAIDDLSKDPHFQTWKLGWLQKRMKIVGEEAGSYQKEVDKTEAKLKKLKEEVTGVIEILSDSE
jgi:hypothetical protein